MHPIENFCVRNRVSIYLCFISATLTATMMRPSGAAVVTLFLNFGVLFLLRSIAHLEGRHAE